MGHMSNYRTTASADPNRTRLFPRACVLGTIISWGAFALSCGGPSAGPVEAPDESTAAQERDTRIIQERCDLDSSGAETQDANGDGRPDLITVTRQRCRAADLNFDGNWDSWVYLASDGQVRRREADFDRDGRVDEIATFEGGQLVAKQQATRLDGRLDTWHYYEQGRLARTERDSDGNAVVDQWWEYPVADKPDCPLVHSDVDGDGRPDPGATVNMCPPDEDAAEDYLMDEPAQPPPGGAPAPAGSGGDPAASAPGPAPTATGGTQ